MLKRILLLTVCFMIRSVWLDRLQCFCNFGNTNDRLMKSHNAKILEYGFNCHRREQLLTSIPLNNECEFEAFFEKYIVYFLVFIYLKTRHDLHVPQSRINDRT